MPLGIFAFARYSEMLKKALRVDRLAGKPELQHLEVAAPVEYLVRKIPLYGDTESSKAPRSAKTGKSFPFPRATIIISMLGSLN